MHWYSTALLASFAAILRSVSCLGPYYLMPIAFQTIVDFGYNDSMSHMTFELFADTTCKFQVDTVMANYTTVLYPRNESFQSFTISRPLEPDEYIDLATFGEQLGTTWDRANETKGLRVGRLAYPCSDRIGTLAPNNLPVNSVGACTAVPTNYLTTIPMCLGIFRNGGPRDLWLPGLYRCNRPGISQNFCAHIDEVYDVDPGQPPV